MMPEEGGESNRLEMEIGSGSALGSESQSELKYIQNPWTDINY
jgi:hypothetical protein